MMTQKNVFLWRNELAVNTFSKLAHTCVYVRLAPSATSMYNFVKFAAQFVASLVPKISFLLECHHLGFMIGKSVLCC